MDLTLRYSQPKKLRYGENPHQNGWVWKSETTDPLAFEQFIQHQGKQLSYNNYLDLDAAVEYLCFLGKKEPTCIVVKHTNACGAAIAGNVADAFKKAWAGDSLAAFGGIIAVNRRVDEKIAQTMMSDNRFFEVLLCPSVTKGALSVFSKNENLRILENPTLRNPAPSERQRLHDIRGGILVQDPDTIALKSNKLKIPTKKEPTTTQMTDLLFAWEICRVSKANCIALVKNRQLIASGVGQQDRMRCCRLAVDKAGKRTKGTIAASDAFFPFKDGPEILISSGVKAIIQPGGSTRDQETIDLCDKNDISMVFTRIRCFKH